MKRSVVVKFGTASLLIIHFFIHLSTNLTPVSPSTDRKTESNRSILNTTPRWEYHPHYTPYMGNLSCIFEVSYWNLESQVNPSDLERRRECGKWRYIPSLNWTLPDPRLVFQKLKHDATIYIAGDSISVQQSADLLCYMFSVAEMVLHRTVIDPRPSPTGWCDYDGACTPDTRPTLTGMVLQGATFRLDNKDINVRRLVGNIGAYSHPRKEKLYAQIEKTKEGDIFVFNGGLHYPYNEPEKLVHNLIAIKPWILAAQKRGVKVLWRETNAAHFNSTDGYYRPYLKELQDEGEAHCVAHSEINATASRQTYNGRATPLLKSWGIPVLETWEATFLFPEWCHPGRGIDCSHFLQPGGTSYFTEALLKYIEEM